MVSASCGLMLRPRCWVLGRGAEPVKLLSASQTTLGATQRVTSAIGVCAYSFGAELITLRLSRSELDCGPAPMKYWAGCGCVEVTASSLVDAVVGRPDPGRRRWGSVDEERAHHPCSYWAPRTVAGRATSGAAAT